METVVSGIRPTGNLHLGNYYGAIKNFIKMQHENNCFFFIADYHSLTTHPNPEDLHGNVKQVLAEYLAVGIDPEIATLYVQSDLPEVAELTLLLSMNAYIGELSKTTSFKEKVRAQPNNVNVGLLSYPVLMAADILLYNTDIVPVGEDQKQHLEYTRDIAQRFNSIYGDVFKLPQPLIAESGARIMGLDDPNIKMGKSETGKWHAIALLDSPDVIREKISRAATDSKREIVFDEDRKGIYNLLTIYELFSGLSKQEIEKKFASKGYADFKKELADVIIEELSPFQEKYKEIMGDLTYLDKLLMQGADKVRPMANDILNTVKDKLGLG